MRIAVVVPVYHTNELHAEFTKQTLESISTQEHILSTYVIVNYSTSELLPDPSKFNQDLHMKVIPNPKGNCVSAAWNLGIKTALAEGNKYVIVTNNDIVWHHKGIDNLVQFAVDHPEFILWTGAEWIDVRTIGGVKEGDVGTSFDEHPHFSCFMVEQRTIDTVGWFDEHLQVAYFEDSDYHTRILLSGNKAGKTASALFYHYGSRTIHVDDELFDKNKSTYEANRNYIKSKWNVDFHGKGFHPPEEILKEPNLYKIPFNDQTKTLKDC